MEPRSILVVSADPAEVRSLSEGLRDAGHAVRVAGTLDEAVASATGSVHLFVVDRGGLDGADPGRSLARLRERHAGVPCLVTLADASVDDAVDLMRSGAFSVVSLPTDGAKLAFQVEQALRHHDLCEKNEELERSLETHERLAMIGKLAAGVAHELNNPLDGVLRFVNLAVDGLPKESPQVPYLLEARRGLRRMADIVRDLLQFSRNANVDATHEDAERLARDAAAQAIGGVQGRRIESAFEFPPTPVPVPRGMFQVLSNLAKNAVDAMPKGGTLTIAASASGGRVRLRVADTGTGIPEEIRERIFEPFFTTKEIGKGTGLGLPICQRIVERLGGTLTIESEVGAGTAVHVELPARRQLPPAPREKSPGPFAVSRSTKE